MAHDCTLTHTIYAFNAIHIITLYHITISITISIHELHLTFDFIPKDRLFRNEQKINTNVLEI